MSLTYKQKIAPFAVERMEAIAKVLADTNNGLTGSEIANQLAQIEVEDVDPLNTKWKRLFNAFVAFQNKHLIGNHIVVFTARAMDPAKYTSKPDLFEERRISLNKILAFEGLELGSDGKMRKVSAAATLDDALARANKMKEQLLRRNVHAEVFRYCTAEILADNYFHAVFEAMKSVAAKVRSLSGLTTDGSELIDEAFALGKPPNPLLAINALNTPTLEGEQRGFVSLVKGLFGVIRNPLAHEPKIDWDMTEQDALDILTTVSLVHRKLDKTYVYRTPS